MGWLSRVFGGDARGPRDSDAALRAAVLAVLDRDFDEAEALLISVAESDSEAVEPYLALARIYRARGEIGRSIRLHQNLLLRLDPGSPSGRDALAGLAADFQRGGFLRRAIAAWEELLTHDPRHLEAHRALARLLVDAREYERAIEVTYALAKLEGGNGRAAEAELRTRIAEVAQSEGRSEEARKAVKKALRRDKKCVSAWILLGELESERGRNKAALAAWSKVPALDASRAGEVYPKLEATWAALEKPREFESALRRILEERPDDVTARIALARHLEARGDVDAAVSELRGLLERRPEEMAVRTALGRMLLSAGRDGEALKDFSALLDVLDRPGGGAAEEAG
jgi:lipopolysaccharide biosynthesis regulator YciM